MKPISLIFSILTLIGVVKSVEVPFEDVIEFPLYSSDENYYSMELALGTPAQKTNVSLQTAYYDYDLRITSKVGTFSGQYDHTKSSTFNGNEKQLYYDYLQFNKKQCSDNFYFGQSDTMKLSFKLIEVNAISPAFLGFSYVNGSHVGEFWQSLFDNSVGTKVTLALDSDLKTGAMTVGDYDKFRCNNDWRILSEEFYVSSNMNQNHFGPKINSIRVGKTTIKSPGYLTFTLSNFGIVWPADVHKALLKEMKSKDGETIPCNTKITINVRMEKFVLRLKPEEYLKKNSDGTCELNGFASENLNEISLSNVLFKRYCIFFDHITRQFGFASAKRN